MDTVLAAASLPQQLRLLYHLPPGAVHFHHQLSATCFPMETHTPNSICHSTPSLSFLLLSLSLLRDLTVCLLSLSA